MNFNFNPDELFISYESVENRTVRPSDEVETHFNNLQATILKLLLIKTGYCSTLTDSQYQACRYLSEWLCGKYKSQQGILLVGSVGNGKTTLMQGFVKYYCWLYKKVINEYHAKTLPLEYKNKGIEYFYKRPLFIDDLGKESAITANWGQKYDTWGDLFAIRYENKSLTFATANYLVDVGFKEIYGTVIADRMKEHFNIYELKGESLRK